MTGSPVKRGWLLAPWFLLVRVAGIAAGIVAGACDGIKAARRKRHSQEQPNLLAVSLVWSVVACVPIAVVGMWWNVPLWVNVLCGAIAGWRVAVWARK